MGPLPRLALIVSSLVLSLTSQGIAVAAPPGSAASSGSLQIDSTTTGAEVFVDGERVGVIPLAAPISIAPGEHALKVSKPGYAPLIDVIIVRRSKASRVEAELVPISGVLRIAASVEKARVFVDGKFVGEAPITAEMPVGARAIQVSKGGYEDFFRNVSSVAGEVVALEIKLKELPVGMNPYKPPPPPPVRWYERWWVWTAGAVGVAAVVTAVVVPLALSQRDPTAGSDYVFTINNR